MRDDSGWNTDDPMPTIAAAARISGYDEAIESITNPTSVKPMPMLSEKGCGRLSV